MKQKDFSKRGQHDFALNHFSVAHPNSGLKTFTVSVFEWVFTRDKSCLKSGTVKVRVIGAPENAAAVYAKAEEIVILLDAGSYAGAKSITVK
jgi:hypothetical protein